MQHPYGRFNFSVHGIIWQRADVTFEHKVQFSCNSKELFVFFLGESRVRSGLESNENWMVLQWQTIS